MNNINKHSMSIVGGLDMYEDFGTRYESDISPFGRKVIFLDKNGYEIERETAQRFFQEGAVLTVKEIYVGNSGSTVEFVEFPTHQFNTVMFCDAD